SAEHEWFWMAGASIGRWHPQAGTRGSVGLRYVYRTPERELGFVVAPVEPLPPWEPMHPDPNLHHPRPLPDMRPEHLLRHGEEAEPLEGVSETRPGASWLHPQRGEPGPEPDRSPGPS